MFSFRQKIFFSYVFVFFLFLALLYPFASKTVNEIVARSLASRADELIVQLEPLSDNDAMIRRLKELKPTIFFRMSVITDTRQVLYDSHAKRMLGPRLFQEHVVDHPEVNRAFREGVGYHEEYSQLFQQEFVYLAKAFNFHGSTYVLRLAFPYKYVQEITSDFEMGFLGLATAILLLFSLMTWLIIHHLTTPISQIISVVHEYEEKGQTTLPEITLPSRNPKDDFAKLAGTLNSLSAKVQAHIDTLVEERNQKALILESLVEGVVAVDNDLRVVFSNDLALKFLRVKRNDFINHDFRSIADSQQLTRLLEDAMRKGAVESDTIDYVDNGKHYYIEASAVPQKERSGAILVLNDKSQQYRLIEMRKDFIANASHELKTPITIIRGYAETLHDNADLPKETIIQVTGRIVNSCLRMSTLIKDLLALSDVDHLSESRLAPCRLTALVGDCISLIKEGYPDAEIILDADVDYLIRADEQLLEMAVTNLLENGVKYSLPPAKVTVALKRVGGNVELAIKDQGIGIPPDDLEHIFERFYTVDKAHSKKLGGTGLGLSLVESIIHKHFGSITVTSQMGKGSVFTVLLPLSLNKALPFNEKQEGEGSDEH